MSERYAVATLGMFIIDDFQLDADQGQQALQSQVGGGGLYTALGARVWLPDGQALVFVDRGYDFPSDIQALLDSFNSPNSLCFRDDPSRQTTRAVNIYSSQRGQVRGFQYLTPKKRLNPVDLKDASRGPEALPPRYLHCICAAGRANDMCSELDAFGWASRVKMVYEPVPDCCVFSDLPDLQRVLPRIDVFSPNHTEAAAWFDQDLVEPDRKTVEALCLRFLDLGAKDMVVIRCGAMGSCGVRRADVKTFHWVPAFHTDQSKVVDPTGGGNSFLGGLMAGLSFDPEDLLRAMLYASVSASYFIEQYGMPRLTVTTSSDDEAGATGGGVMERWNEPGSQPLERLQLLKQRL